VDKHQVPVPHFGIILTPAEFEALVERLRGNVDFVIEPSIRFAGTPGEQRTLFFRDPNNYALEFKSFADDRFIFEPFEA
jgi:extradiol dioxygenase family protein